MGLDAKEQALVLMWNDIQIFEGYLGIQEVLRNGHEAFKDRALGGPVPERRDQLLFFTAPDWVDRILAVIVFPVLPGME